MNLAELERYFARAATSGSGPLPDLSRVFVGSERLSAEERLSIYNRGYFQRLLEALASVFSHTKRLLGAADFERLAISYVASHPSEHPAVERVGRSFSEYLRSVAAPTVVVDLAALEWARLSALVAENPRTVATVDAIEPSRFPQARLHFVPALHFLELDPRALSAFGAGAGTVFEPAANDAQRARCGVAVWRSRHAVRHQSLPEAEWQALVCAASGKPLSHVCAVFAGQSATEDVQRAFQVLSGWFARKWLERVAYPDP